MNRLTHIAVCALLLTTVAACSSSPDPNSFGGKLQIQGGEAAAIGKKWTDAENAIADARGSIADGEEDVDDGEALISKGQRKISRGESQLRTAERMKTQAEEEARLFDLKNKGPIAVPAS